MKLTKKEIGKALGQKEDWFDFSHGDYEKSKRTEKYYDAFFEDGCLRVILRNSGSIYSTENNIVVYDIVTDWIYDFITKKEAVNEIFKRIKEESK